MTKRKYDEAIEELGKVHAEAKTHDFGYRYFMGIEECIRSLKNANSEPPVTTLELAQAYAEPERLITENTPVLIREVYRINPTFHAIVTRHEIEGSSYLKALEETVVNLASEIARRDIATMNQIARAGVSV